jgi:hypothetical protein
LKAYTRKLKGKRFTLIGEGADAKVWRIEGAEGKRKKGTVFRRSRRGRYPHYDLLRKHELQVRFLASKIAFELFPKNVLQVTGVNVEKGVMRSKQSKPDKLLVEAKRLDRLMEPLTRKNRLGKLTEKEFERLNELAKEEAKVLKEARKRQKNPVVLGLYKEFLQAGFHFDASYQNISMKDPHNPVFYEVTNVIAERVLRHMEREGVSAGKRKKVERLLREIDEADAELERQWQKEKGQFK